MIHFRSNIQTAEFGLYQIYKHSASLRVYKSDLNLLRGLYLRVRDSKFCILHSAPATSFSIQNFSFIVHSARACICKQNTHLTVSNTFNI